MERLTQGATAIRELVAATPFIDTHEHLIEESRRLAGPLPDDSLLPCDDWAYLLHHYSKDDLAVAGMPPEALQRFFSPTLSPQEKWRLVAPYWSRIRHTGYGRAVQITVQQLYGVAELNEDSVETVTARMRATVEKGFYRRILHEYANVELCQVHSLEHIFCETQYPDLLFQDLDSGPMSISLDVQRLRRQTGLPLDTLSGYHEAIDWYFERFAGQAVAMKNLGAYQRRLNYAPISSQEAAPLYVRYAKDKQALSDAEVKALQDHLWRYCVQRSTDYGLPVKLHTGYYAGTNQMPLARVRQNLSDLCPILQDFPNTTFILMHMAYPYQDEMVAVAKQYTNAYVDLCWAWLCNPLATMRFVKEFLVSVPWNKLLTFGGDYYSLEPIVGHAAIARQGLTQALSELMVEGWLTEEDAQRLVRPLMRDNAWELFQMDEKLKTAQQMVTAQT